MILKNKKKTSVFLLILFSAVGLLFLAAPAQANWAANVVGGLIGVIISALGVILALVMKVLVAVAQYNNFIYAPAITNGWVVVRDVCNMFFVLILLVIAFATILRIENYSYKKWLPKLILMAILINFSKTICGLLIDAAQVVMLTFVNAFKDLAAGSLITNLGIQEILTLAKDNTDVTFWQIVGAYILGLIYILIALVVVVTMLAMLVMRIVMLWIYVVLSPAAYLFSSFPGGQKYSSQWWSEFTKNLIVGPVLAFFIWLSFVSLQADTINKDFPTGEATVEEVAGEMTIQPEESGEAFAASEASTPQVFMKFIIAIGMLLGGLKISQEIGGAAGGMAGKGMGKISKGAAFAGGAIGGFALGRAKATGRAVRNAGVYGASWASKGLGKAVGNNKVGNTLKATGDIGLAWRSDMMAANKKKKQEKRQKFLEKMGMGEKTMDKTSQFLKTDTGKEFAAATKAGGYGAAVGSLGGWAGVVAGGVVGFAGGGLVNHLFGKRGAKMNKKAEEEDNNAQTFREDAEVARAAGSKDSADEYEIKAEKAEKKAKKYRNKAKRAGTVQTFGSELTQKAAAKGSSDLQNARDRVKTLATDPDAMKGPDGFGAADFYNKSGQSAQQKKLFEQLADRGNADAAPALDNLIAWANGADLGDKKEKAKFDALIRGLAAFKKGGGNMSNMGKLTSALNARSTIGAVNDLEGKVIANRMTGKIGEKGDGSFHVNTFANNDDNESGKNIIGVDFAKLAGSGLDVKAEASFASGSEIAPIAKAILSQIDAERASLEEQHNSGEIDDKEYGRKSQDLDRAQARLSDPNLKNLDLVNTGSANYGRQEKMISAYHEEIHAGGVKDEDITEGTAQKLMDNKLYGRNAATGGRHATEIAQKVKGWQADGMDNDQIMAKVDEEIKARLEAEGKSRAERVISIEQGKKETETEAFSPAASESTAAKSAAAETPALDIEGFQESLDTLADKIKKMASGISGTGQTGASGSDQGLFDRLSFPLKQLNANMRKNVSAMKSLNSKIGKQAPTTIVEASAINDEISS